MVIVVPPRPPSPPHRHRLQKRDTALGQHWLVGELQAYVSNPSLRDTSNALLSGQGCGVATFAGLLSRQAVGRLSDWLQPVLLPWLAGAAAAQVGALEVGGVGRRSQLCWLVGTWLYVQELM